MAEVTLTHDKTWYHGPDGAKSVTYVMGELAYFLDKLKTTTEGLGTNLLDSMLLYATTEFQDASAQEAASQEVFARAASAQLAASKTGVELPSGSGTRNLSSARFGSGGAVTSTPPSARVSR